MVKHLAQKRLSAHPWPDHSIDPYAAQKTALLICAGFTPNTTIPEYDPGAVRLNKDVSVSKVENQNLKVEKLKKSKVENQKLKNKS